ncbi:hypothetical protein MTO96_048376 [Rhipicephalus appendiculatus]
MGRPGGASQPLPFYCLILHPEFLISAGNNMDDGTTGRDSLENENKKRRVAEEESHDLDAHKTGRRITTSTHTSARDLTQGVARNESRKKRAWTGGGARDCRQSKPLPIDIVLRRLRTGISNSSTGPSHRVL